MPTKRILFLGSGKTVPSTRYRLLPYLPRLRQHGYRCDLALSFPEKYEYFPSIGWRPSQKLKRAVRHWHLFHAWWRKYDVIVLERELFDDPTWDLERRFRQVTERLILDIDDAVFLRHPEKFPRIVQMVDCVVAGNRALAEACHAHCPDVRIVPTPIDLDDYPQLSSPANSPPVIGWIGTPSNLSYLSEVLPALDELAQRMPFRLRIVSSGESRLSGLQLGSIEIEFRRWQPEKAAAEISAFDIGIMPLPDSEWTRYKCGFKLLQYMAAGVPAVGSPVGANREIIQHGENGFLAGTPSHWVQILATLLEDKQFRRQVGASGRRRVEAHYSVTRCLPLLMEALDQNSILGNQ